MTTALVLRLCLVLFLLLWWWLFTLYLLLILSAFTKKRLYNSLLAFFHLLFPTFPLCPWVSGLAKKVLVWQKGKRGVIGLVFFFFFLFFFCNILEAFPSCIAWFVQHLPARFKRTVFFFFRLAA